MKILRTITVLLFLLTINHQPSTIINAQIMSNGSYILEQGGLSSFAGRSTGTQNTLTSSGGKLAPGVYTGENYIIRANFNYGESASSSALLFTISNTSINFGTIKPGDPVIRTNTLLITSPNSGYQVSASENNSLRNSSGAQIPDTSCDSGNCTESTPALWVSPLTYGFGYRCDNVQANDCSSAFGNPNYFMPFSNISASETPHTIMDGISPTQNSEGQITYKLNISGTQASGVYQNTIQYIAIPSL